MSNEWTDLDASIAFDAAWEDDDPDLQFQCEACGRWAQRPALIVWDEERDGSIIGEHEMCEFCFRVIFELKRGERR